MSVQITDSMILYDKIIDVNATINIMGNAIAKSQMFGCSSLEQGIVFAMECIAQRIPPLTLARRFHVIDNKISQKVDSMMDDFISSGCQSRIIERTQFAAEVELTKPNDKQCFRFTWEEAQREPYVYQGKQADIMKYLAEPTKYPRPPFRDKYATPRSRMQMLWARVVSDGIRAMGGVNHGVYTPEELDTDAMDDDGGDVVNAEYTAANDPPMVATSTPAATTTPTPTPQPVAEDAVVAPPNEVGKATAEQVAKIESLMTTLYPYEQRVATLAKLLAKRNIGCLTSMLADDAAEMITKLQAGVQQMMAAGKPAQAAVGKTTDPCSKEQEASIKEELAKLEQVNPGSLQKFVAALQASGRKKIAEFTDFEARECIVLLQAKQLEKYISESLTKKVKEGESAGKDVISF